MLNDPTFWMGFGFGGFLFSSLAALIVARLLDKAIAEVEQDDEPWVMDSEALKSAGRYVMVATTELSPLDADTDDELFVVPPAEWRRSNAK